MALVRAGNLAGQTANVTVGATVGNLVVTGTGTVVGPLNVSNVAVAGNLTVGGTLTLGGTVDVTGNTTLGNVTASKLTVTGNTALTNVAITGTITANGSVVGISYSQSSALATGTTILPNDDTIPQNTEGTEVLTVTHTPKSANNRLMIEIQLTCSGSLATSSVVVALFKDSDVDAIAASHDRVAAANASAHPGLIYHMVAGTTAAITFKVRIGPQAAATVYMNGAGGARDFGGVASSSITVTEISSGT